jgi:hypothetical protein
MFVAHNIVRNVTFSRVQQQHSCNWLPSAGRFRHARRMPACRFTGNQEQQNAASDAEQGMLASVLDYAEQ